MTPVLNRQTNTGKKKKTIWISLISFVILCFVLCTAISLYVGISLTKLDKSPAVKNPGDYGMHYSNQVFLSKDGITHLKGWMIEPTEQPKATIIMSHGYGNNREAQGAGFLPLSKEFVKAGYRVVMFDFRDSGDSEGNQTTIGVKEQLDLLGVIQKMKETTKEPIVLYGISMGAATSLLAASQDDDVKAVVADSPFSDLTSYLKENLSVWSHLPNFPFTPLTIAILPVIADVNPAEASPIKAVEHIYPRPILFIHSTGDTKIPYTESEKMAKTHPDAFHFWKTDKAEHVQNYHVYKKEYVKRVLTFIDQSL